MPLTVVDPPKPRRRWPGTDGWALFIACGALVLLWLVRDVQGFGPAIAVCVALTVLYGAATRAARSASRTEYVRPSEIRILTVIPTHNNIGTIARIVQDCFEYTEDLLVVDDGSHDGSGTAASDAGAIVLRHDINQGKGAALDTALHWAAQHGFTHIVAIDADAQHYASDLPAFFDRIAQRPDAIHLGVRDMSSVGRVPRGARANSNFWVRVETGRWMGDTQSGYRAYPVHATLDLALVPSRYQWEVDVLVRAAWRGIAVIDLPIAVFYPPAGERVSSYRKVVDTGRMTWLNAQLVMERLFWPPRWVRRSPQASWDGRSRGFSLGWQLYITLIRRGYRRMVQSLLTPPILFYTLTSGGQGAAIRAYLARRQPERSLLGRWIGLFGLYRNFAFSIVDRFHLLLRDDDDITLDRSGAATLAAHFADPTSADKGLLILSGHLGNADFVSTLIRGGERPVRVVVHVTPDDPYMRMMQQERGDNALQFIELGGGDRQASIAVLNALRDGDVVAMKVDRPTGTRSTRVRFLGGTMAISTGPFVLAAMSGVPTVIVGCFRTGHSSYALYSIGPRIYRFTSRAERSADLDRWAQEFADHLAEWTERYPLQWYNFFDVWDTDATPMPARSGSERAEVVG